MQKQTMVVEVACFFAMEMSEFSTKQREIAMAMLIWIFELAVSRHVREPEPKTLGAYCRETASK